MNKEPKFKYQKQIDELLAKGCQLPELFAPNNMHACRFAFIPISAKRLRIFPPQLAIPFPKENSQMRTD